MAIPLTGLSVQTSKEVLDSIISTEQQEVSSSIDTSSDTALGQLNQIMANQIESVNLLLQDIYDQRNILAAEGKALDDNVSWLGITRQGATPTKGEQYFKGNEGTTIPAGSFVQNTFTLESFTLDQATSLSKSACREITLGILQVLDSTLYTVSVQGIQYNYTSSGSATAQEIVTGLVTEITTPVGLTYTATDNLDETFTISVTNFTDVIIDNDDNLGVESVVSAGNVTCTVTGGIPAPQNTVTTILSPINGLKSTNNPEAYVIGRSEETDSELRNRAISFRSTAGKATVDSMVSALLQVDGVSSAAVNERFVSQGDSGLGQPAGSLQIVVAGGTDDDEIAQTIWDTKPAGVQIWALNDSTYNSGTARDYYDELKTIEFNRPTNILMVVTVTYQVFDTGIYPENDQDAYDAIANAIVTFGNSLGAGEDVKPSEFEGVVYGAVSGIYNVFIQVNSSNGNAGSYPATETILMSPTEEAFFDFDQITVTKQP